MAKTTRKSALTEVKDLPLMKEWKVSRYFRKTVAQLHTELKNAPEINDSTTGQNCGTLNNLKGLRSIPGMLISTNYFEL